jgi:hypothetical protein
VRILYPGQNIEQIHRFSCFLSRPYGIKMHPTALAFEGHPFRRLKASFRSAAT